MVSSFSSKVIKTAGVPICSVPTLGRTLRDRFDFSRYKGHRHQNTPEKMRDAAILLSSGLTVGMATVITEQNLEGSGFNYACSLAKHGFTDEDVAATFAKYQKELEMFGHHKLELRPDWLKDLTANRAIVIPNRHRLKLTPDQVGRLVFAYEDALSEGLAGQKALLKAARKANVHVSIETLKNSLFNHKDVPGYEHIKTPYQLKEKTDVRDKATLDTVQKVKFLSARRGWGVSEIASELDVKRATVYKICKGITFSQVTIDPDTERVLEIKYPKM